MKIMSNLLALDQSSRITGYAIFEDSKLVKYGKFEVSDTNIDQRLVKIKTKVEELIRQYNINQVVFEDIQLQNNVANNIQTFKALAEVYGVIAEMLEEAKLPHCAILASSWKSTLGIKGKTRPEQKKNAQQYIQQQYGIKPAQDTVDAICIGLHYLYQNRNDWSQ